MKPQFFFFVFLGVVACGASEESMTKDQLKKAGVTGACTHREEPTDATSPFVCYFPAENAACVASKGRFSEAPMCDESKYVRKCLENGILTTFYSAGSDTLCEGKETKLR